MKRVYIIAALMFLLLITLIGCNRDEEIPAMTAEEITATLQNIPDLPFGEASNAMSYFSQELFLQVLAIGENNAVISPISAYYALAMVALGAGGDTLQEFQTVLGIAPEDLAPQLHYLSQALMSVGGSTKLNLAASVWVADNPLRDLTTNYYFNRAMLAYFDAYARIRNFLDTTTIDEINTWISDQTQGLIDEAISEIDPDAIMLLVNTVYLSARWASAFNPMIESVSTFYLESGEPLEVPFLSTNTRTLFAISVTDYYEAVLLPYNDGRLGFFLVRPTDGTTIRDFVATHDLVGILGELEDHHGVQVQMPKLDKEFDIKMNEQLQTMGLELAFDEVLSVLSGLVEEDMIHPIYISRVHQAVRIRVCADGTEAAVVTTVEAVVEDSIFWPIELNFNTPYVYMIYDFQTGAILFMGVVDNPVG